MVEESRPDIWLYLPEMCIRDRLSAWFKNFNRYNNGSEEQFWLSVFSAKTTISDRKNAKDVYKRQVLSVSITLALGLAPPNDVPGCTSCAIDVYKRQECT